MLCKNHPYLIARESVLTEAEKESFEIEKFIFHIIIEKDHIPTYLDEVNLTEDQALFFKRRFSDISEGTQFVFPDKQNSTFHKACKLLYEEPEAHFINVSKELTRSFKDQHTKNTNDGVFITALVKVQESRKLIFLLKLDHRTVYRYKAERSRALLEEIKNTFVEDKKAIQKAALIDITDYYVWDVLAKDRTAQAMRKSISDYFSKFLQVTERETPSKLTEMAVRFANKWAIENKAELDPDQEPSSYKSRAIKYLSSTSKFDTEEFINIVVNNDDTNQERRDNLRASFKNYLDDVGMTGQSFVPNKNSLNKAKKKNVRMTAEGIRLEWIGDPNEANLTIPQQKNADGYYHILIKTSDIQNLDSVK